MTERYSVRLIWGDLALPELASSFRLAIGPIKMILALFAVFVVCLLGFVMDTCSRNVVTGPDKSLSDAVITELDKYIETTPKKTKEFIGNNVGKYPRKGVFSTLWEFVSDRFHSASTQLLNLTDTNLYSNIRYVFLNVWLCIRAVGWALRFHPIYSTLYFSVVFLVFVFTGGAITRCAALEFAKAERPGLFEVIAYAAQNYRSFLVAPLLPLGLVIVFSVVVLVLGMMVAIPVAGEFVMIFSFGFVLFFGLLVTLMTLGTVAGGMLLFPSIAFENTTGLDSIGRSFSYVLTRPTWMVYYFLISGVFGTFFYLVFRLLVFLAIRLTHMLLFAGMMLVDSQDKLQRIWPQPALLNFSSNTSDPQTWSEGIAALVIRGFMLAIVGLLLSYIVSYFFSSASVIYALMRKKIDGVGTEEVYVHLENIHSS